MKTVIETHKELFHYTTGPGLEAILRSQQLRATRATYLNDAEEQVGFFDRRLPIVLSGAATAAVADAKNTAEGSKRIQEMGGETKAIDTIVRGLRQAIRNTSLEHDHPYVTSFCTAATEYVAANGLLSQWRGYGTDGGYAIVFDVKALDGLLREEGASHCYAWLGLGDVDYYDNSSEGGATNEETRELEAIVRERMKAFLLDPSPEQLETVGTPLIQLSCLHKHRGFAEEREVRIVGLVPQGRMLEDIRKGGHTEPDKAIHFAARGGLLIPHIFLFDGVKQLGTVRLPISRIIVGPHREQESRLKSTELLLRQHRMDATVTRSDIPYLGR